MRHDDAGRQIHDLSISTSPLFRRTTILKVCYSVSLFSVQSYMHRSNSNSGLSKKRPVRIADQNPHHHFIPTHLIISLSHNCCDCSIHCPSVQMTASVSSISASLMTRWSHHVGKRPRCLCHTAVGNKACKIDLLLSISSLKNSTIHYWQDTEGQPKRRVKSDKSFIGHVYCTWPNRVRHPLLACYK